MAARRGTGTHQLPAERLKSFLETVRADTSALSRNHRDPRKYRFQEHDTLPPIGQLEQDGGFGQAIMNHSGSLVMPTSPETPGAKSPGRGQVATLDEYDPRSVTQQEQARLQQEVIELRRSSSDRRNQLRKLEHELETTRNRLHILRAEDNVEQQKAEALAKLEDLDQQLHRLQDRLSRAGGYEMTLQHMRLRLQRQKVDNRAAMITMEEALRVHRREVQLQSRFQADVQNAVVGEENAAGRLAREEKLQRQQLDDAVEARRQEALRYHRRAIEKQKRMKEEIRLKARAEGDLTREEEMALRRQVATLRAENMTAMKQLRLQVIAADRVESTFNAVRVAAGLKAPPREDGGEGKSAIVPPDSTAIVQRFHDVRQEVDMASAHVQDVLQRLGHLRSLKSELQARLQPAARDAADEQDLGVQRLEAEQTSLLGARRTCESLKREAADVRKVASLLQQSIEGLYVRLAPLRYGNDAPRFPRITYHDDLEGWAKSLTEQLEAVASIITEARHELQSKGLLPSSIPLGPNTPMALAYRSNASPRSAGINRQAVEESLEVTMSVDAIVAENEAGVRVPLARDDSAPTGPVSVKDIQSAIHRFRTKERRELEGRKSPNPARRGGREDNRADGGSQSHPLSRESVRRRRRDSKLELQAAVTAALSADEDVIGGAEGQSPGGGDTLRVTSASSGRALPQQEMVRLFAAASKSAGIDVQDAYNTQETMDADDEPVTHEKVKRRMQHEYRQLLNRKEAERKAAKAASTQGASGRHGGRRFASHR